MVLTLLALALCPAQPKNQDLLTDWPVTWQTDPETGKKEFFLHFPPLFESVTTPQRVEKSVFRPLAFSYMDEHNSKQTGFVWPIYTASRHFDQTWEWHLNPLIHYRTYANGSSRFSFIPLIYWSNEPAGNERPESRGFFPVWGQIYNRLGRDKIEYTLWPIYARSWTKQVSYKYMFWPVFASYYENQQPTGGRIWPIAGWNDTAAKKSWFFLWPIFSKSTAKDPEHPESSWWCFPICGKFDSPVLTERKFMWPLFTYRKKTDKHGNVLERNTFFWPVGRTIKQNGQLQGFDVWPLYGRFETKLKQKEYLLWPFFVHKTHTIPGIKEEKTTRSVIIVSKNTKTQEKLTKYRCFWPFFEHQITTTPQGKDNDFALACLWPSGEKRQVREAYAPLWRILRYKKTPQDQVYFSLFWGLIRYAGTPEDEQLGVAFFKLRKPKSRKPVHLRHIRHKKR